MHTPKFSHYAHILVGCLAPLSLSELASVQIEPINERRYSVLRMQSHL